jgi:hypothetical protein
MRWNDPAVVPEQCAGGNTPMTGTVHPGFPSDDRAADRAVPCDRQSGRGSIARFGQRGEG